MCEDQEIFIIWVGKDGCFAAVIYFGVRLAKSHLKYRTLLSFNMRNPAAKLKTTHLARFSQTEYP